jgi:hypothetical protein
MALAGSTADNFIKSAQELVPKIRKLRHDIERERTLPSDLVAAMGNAGLFSL